MKYGEYHCIFEEERKIWKFGDKRMQSLLEGMCNKAEYGLKDSRKAAGQLKEFSNSKVMLNVLNRSNSLYQYGKNTDITYSYNLYFLYVTSSTIISKTYLIMPDNKVTNVAHADNTYIIDYEGGKRHK